MSIRMIGAAAAIALGALAAAPLALASISRHVVHGRLFAVAEEDAANGRFQLASIDRGNGDHFERIEVSARRLDVSGFSATQRPSFHVFLVKADGSGEADFGAMRVNRHGAAFFHFDSPRRDLPSGVSTITDYGGGTIEVRDAGGAVLSGDIPTFIDLDDDGGIGQRASGQDRERLRPVQASFAGRGEVMARRRNLPGGANEELRLTVGGAANATTYTAVAIAADSTETQLGTFTTSNPLGLGGFHLITAQGDTIPGGGVLALAGQTVEVRDAGGNAVLRGDFPTIE